MMIASIQWIDNDLTHSVIGIAFIKDCGNYNGHQNQ